MSCRLSLEHLACQTFSSRKDAKAPRQTRCANLGARVFLCAFASLRELKVWHARCSRDNPHDTEYTELVTVPPPPTSPERRLPLRQLPSERPFSASPRYADLVRNDRVFPLLKRFSKSSYKYQSDLSELLKTQRVFGSTTNFVTLPVTFSVFLSQITAI